MPLSPFLRRPAVPLASVALLTALALPGSTAAVAAPTSPALPSTPTRPAPAATQQPAATSLQKVRVQVPSGLGAAPFDRARTLSVPKGWTVSVWARTDKPRLEALTPDGRLLVSRPAHGDVLVLTPRKGGQPTSATLVRGLRQPHGLVFDGSTLYVAESNRVDSYRYSAGKVGARSTVLDGLPDGESDDLNGAYAHALKSVAVGHNHALYVSVGSTGNLSATDRHEDPQRATILRVAKGAHTSTVFARGVRNGTGLAFAPDGALWTAVNNRDNVAYPFHKDYDGKGGDDYKKVVPAYVNDHPIEPFAHIVRRRDLGWPYCNPTPDVHAGVRGTAFDYSSRPFDRDVQTNANGRLLDCSKLPRLEQGLPAHSAPLGLSFTRTSLAGVGSGALVGVHGSWNRQPPRAPEVSFFPYSKGSMGDRRTILSGFQGSDGGRWGRPVAAVQGADGAVYVSDDRAGAVYRLAPPA